MNVQTDPRIKNCPYTTCGHQAKLEKYLDTVAGDHFQVECPHCNAAGPFCDTEDAAIQEWNAIERHEIGQIEPALLPCPCCGARAAFEKYGGPTEEWYAFCTGCNLLGAQGTKVQAATVWNRRHGTERR